MFQLAHLCDTRCVWAERHPTTHIHSAAYHLQHYVIDSPASFILCADRVCDALCVRLHEQLTQHNSAAVLAISYFTTTYCVQAMTGQPRTNMSTNLLLLIIDHSKHHSLHLGDTPNPFACQSRLGLWPISRATTYLLRPQIHVYLFNCPFLRHKETRLAKCWLTNLNRS